jgi:DNA-binding NtrC family response regulator
MSDVLRRVTDEVERRKIEQALQQAGGNKAHVADVLNIGYKVLLQKLKAFGIAAD